MRPLRPQGGYGVDSCGCDGPVRADQDAGAAAGDQGVRAPQTENLIPSPQDRSARHQGGVGRDVKDRRNKMQQRWLTPAQAATKYGVHPKSLARWADDEVVEVRKTPGGHRRYSEESLETVLGRAQTQSDVDRAAIRAALRGIAC